MGIFTSLFGGLKSDSINVVSNLLQHQVEHGFLNDDPKLMAKHLVNHIWSQSPDVFEGRFGQHPFKLIVAAYALAKGYNLYSNTITKHSIFISLGNALQEIQVNGAKYPLNSLDQELLREVNEITISIQQAIQPTLVNEDQPYVMKKQDNIDDLTNFIHALSSENERQISTRLATLLVLRNELINENNANEAILNGTDTNSLARQALLTQLGIAHEGYKRHGASTFANGALLWIRILFSYEHDETVNIASEIWKALHKKEGLVTQVFNEFEEDGVNGITLPVRNSLAYTPTILKSLKDNSNAAYQTYNQDYKLLCDLITGSVFIANFTMERKASLFDATRMMKEVDTAKQDAIRYKKDYGHLLTSTELERGVKAFEEARILNLRFEQYSKSL